MDLSLTGISAKAAHDSKDAQVVWSKMTRSLRSLGNRQKMLNSATPTDLMDWHSTIWLACKKWKTMQSARKKIDFFRTWQEMESVPKIDVYIRTPKRAYWGKNTQFIQKITFRKSHF